MAYPIQRKAYAETYGPTTGDRVRLADTGLFIAPERDLIADLIKVSHRLRAFTIQTANSQADLLQTAKHFFNLPCNDQCGKVKHHAYAHSSPNICRACREITQSLMKRVGNLTFD